jgi:hypothetical protein
MLSKKKKKNTARVAGVEISRRGRHQKMAPRDPTPNSNIPQILFYLKLDQIFRKQYPYSWGQIYM